MKIIKVNDENIGKRIDAYLAANTENSRANIQRLIENEKIQVNGKKVKVSYKIQKDDEINIRLYGGVVRAKINEDIWRKDAETWRNNKSTR